MMEAENIKIVYTVDSTIDKDSWNGRTGFIAADMIRQEITDYTDRVFLHLNPQK